MPVYEDATASGYLFDELAKQFGTSLYLIVVDDGSVREPVQPSRLENAGLRGEVLRLKRNVGHQRAMAIGLSHSTNVNGPETRVVAMDSDGEDLPSTIPALLLALNAPDVDIVVAQRRSRVESFRFKLFYAVYKLLFKLLTGRVISFGNFMAMKPSAVRRLVCMQELGIHVAGAALLSKLRLAYEPLDRGPRYAGQSKMNFVGLALHGFKALMVFAEDVLVRVGIACAGVAFFTVIASVFVVLLKVLEIALPGWASIALGILLLAFLQTGALTLMTLMLTGIVRSNTVALVDYERFIDVVCYVRTAPTS